MHYYSVYKIPLNYKKIESGLQCERVARGGVEPPTFGL
jgi:hypothetical protein